MHSQAAKKQAGTRESGDDPIAGYAERLVSSSTANAGKTAIATPEKEPSSTTFGPGEITDVWNCSVSRDAPFIRGDDASCHPGWVVYEKDLRPNTTKVAPGPRQGSPDSSCARGGVRLLRDGKTFR